MIQSDKFDSSNMDIKKLSNSALLFVIKRLIEIFGVSVSLMGILIFISLIFTNIREKNKRKIAGLGGKARDKNGKAITNKDYQGKKFTAQEYIEYAIATPTSKLYLHPTGEVIGKDYQVQYIIDVIHQVEGVAYKRMIKEYPEIMERFKLQNEYLKEEFQNQKSIIKALIN